GPQPLILIEQMSHVAVQEAGTPHALQNRLEVTDLVLPGQRSTRRHLQKRPYRVLIALKQGKDNVRLVTEVVVQVARRDAQRLGDMVSGDIALAEPVEQLQAGGKDALFSAGHIGPEVLFKTGWSQQSVSRD